LLSINRRRRSNSLAVILMTMMGILGILNQRYSFSKKSIRALFSSTPICQSTETTRTELGINRSRRSRFQENFGPAKKFHPEARKRLRKLITFTGGATTATTTYSTLNRGISINAADTMRSSNENDKNSRIKSSNTSATMKLPCENQRWCTLLVSTEADTASITMRDSLLRLFGDCWEPLVPGNDITKSSSSIIGSSIDTREKKKRIEYDPSRYEGARCYRYYRSQGKEEEEEDHICCLWTLPKQADFLHLDHIDEAFLDHEYHVASSAADDGADGNADYDCKDQIKYSIKEVVFLSRHQSKSGSPALTVHPIGIPRPSKWTKEMGGHAGKCPPPSASMGWVFRELKKQARESGISEEFQVTFEATHHGPYLRTPAMFLEIGSKQDDWVRQDAGDCWARTLQNTILSSNDSSSGSSKNGGVVTLGKENNTQHQVVVLSLGGGHYVPFINDIVLNSDSITPGHMLPSYLLDDIIVDNQEGKSEGEREWERAIKIAVDATYSTAMSTNKNNDDDAGNMRESERNAKSWLKVYIDKKSFKAPARQKIIDLLQQIGLEYTTKKRDTVFFDYRP